MLVIPLGITKVYDPAPPNVISCPVPKVPVAQLPVDGAKDEPPPPPPEPPDTTNLPIFKSLHIPLLGN
jgi:hypothetical protein